MTLYYKWKAARISFPVPDVNPLGIRVMSVKTGVGGCAQCTLGQHRTSLEMMKYRTVDIEELLRWI